MSKDQNHFYESSSQTAGPYVHIGLQTSAAGFNVYEKEFSNDLVEGTSAAGGEVSEILISGIVHDGNGDPLKDCLLEIWQADENGNYSQGYTAGQFRGWGRTSADFDTGRYSFRTIKPGAVKQSDGSLMAPHIAFWIVARGINIGLHTRLYFPEDKELFEADPVLNLVPDDRKSTLIASDISADGKAVYEFNVSVQGNQETVFFDV